MPEIKLHSFRDKVIDLEKIQKELAEFLEKKHKAKLTSLNINSGWMFGARENIGVSFTLNSNNYSFGFSIGPFHGNCGAGTISNINYTIGTITTPIFNDIVDWIFFKVPDEYPRTGIYLNMTKTWNGGKSEDLKKNGWIVFEYIWKNKTHGSRGELITLLRINQLINEEGRFKDVIQEPKEVKQQDFKKEAEEQQKVV